MHSLWRPLAIVLVLLVQPFDSYGQQPSGSAASDKRPLKVFVLAGQSNMQGHARLSTIDAMELDPNVAPLLAEMRDAQGKLRVLDDVWISSIGSSSEERTGNLTAGFGADAGGTKIGPEFTFGITMRRLLGEPVLIIKTAWGGKSLHTDFRPPSAGPYQFGAEQLAAFERQGKDIAAIEAEKAAATGVYYREMIDHVRHVLADIERVVPTYDKQQGYELAGFVWFQGWNDMVDGGHYPNRDQPGGYDDYSKLMATFIRDVRRDLDAPRLPFVIGVMGVGGPLEQYGPRQQREKAVHGNFRAAMAAPAALPEFAGTVVAVETAPFWDMQVVALREREQSFKPDRDAIEAKMKSGELTREAGRAAIDELFAAEFTPRELTILRDSVSNFDFHYMGSGKIMAQIGKAFAEGLAEISER